jgi:hypothetical protein
MAYQTTIKQSLYNQKIRSLFTQLICETESLYIKVVEEQYSNAEKLTTQSISDRQLVKMHVPSISQPSR